MHALAAVVNKDSNLTDDTIVLSLFSSWGSSSKNNNITTSSYASTPDLTTSHNAKPGLARPQKDTNNTAPLEDVPLPSQPTTNTATATASPTTTKKTNRLSRPISALFTSKPTQPQQPPLVDVSPKQTPELDPIFTYLSKQGNKLYQEGYFLKLNDLDNSRFFFFFSLDGGSPPSFENRYADSF